MNKLKEYADEYWDIDYTTGSIKWKKLPKKLYKVKIGDEVGAIDKSKGYRMTCIKGLKVTLHRALFSFYYGWTPEVVDHRNGDRSDNSIGNLKASDFEDNSKNQKLRKDNTSGYKGVSYNKDKDKYHSYYQKNGKLTYLGSYENKHIAGVIAGVMRELEGYSERHIGF